MSTFRRQPLSRNAEVGTRPGLHGQTLVSTGIADLDRLLGGGLPLGGLLLLLEDPALQQHLTFVKCFLAEGLACGHLGCWLAPRPQPGGAAAFLPPVAAAKPDSTTTTNSSSSSTSSSGTSSAPESTTDSSTAASASQLGAPSGGDDGLRIAWQYRKYIKQQHDQPQAAAQGSAQRAEGAARTAAATATAARAGSSFVRAGRQRAAASTAAAAGLGGAAVSTSSAAASTSAAGAKALDAGVSREWCHRFDASKPVGQDALAAGRLEYHTDWATDHHPAAAAAAAAATPTEAMTAVALDFANRLLQPPAAGAPGQPPVLLPVREPSKIGRLVIQSLGSFDWQPGGDDPAALGSGSSSGDGGSGCSGAALLQAVARLRLAVQDSSCAALITCPGGLFADSAVAQLSHLCDAVLSLETLADDSEVYRLVPDQNRCGGMLALAWMVWFVV